MDNSVMDRVSQAQGKLDSAALSIWRLLDVVNMHAGPEDTTAATDLVEELIASVLDLDTILASLPEPTDSDEISRRVVALAERDKAAVEGLREWIPRATAIQDRLSREIEFAVDPKAK